MEQSWFYSSSVFFNRSIEAAVSVASDFVEAPSQMLEYWYGLFVFIDLITITFLIFLILFLY